MSEKKEKTSPAHQAFVGVIGAVPRGRVASYGQIATLAGYPGHARQVVWTLHSSSRKYRLPWHRILNSQGMIGHFDERYALRQKALLIGEGIEFNEYGKIDLKTFLWAPKKDELKKLLRRATKKKTIGSTTR